MKYINNKTIIYSDNKELSLPLLEMFQVLKNVYSSVELKTAL